MIRFICEENVYENQKNHLYILALVITVTGLSITASAEGTRASLFIGSYNAVASAKDRGEIAVSFQVAATGIMDSLGASSIRMEERRAGASTWTVVGTYTDDAAWMRENSSIKNGTFYYSGKAGYSYRAHVTLRAGKGGESDSRSLYTNIVLAK